MYTAVQSQAYLVLHMRSLVSKMWKHISEKNDDVEACLTMLRMGREPSSKKIVAASTEFYFFFLFPKQHVYAEPLPSQPDSKSI